MDKITIKQVKSQIGANPNQRKTLRALGLKKIGNVRIHDQTPVIMGMVDVVRHLISIEKKA